MQEQSQWTRLNREILHQRIPLSMRPFLILPGSEICHFALISLQKTHNNIQEDTLSLTPLKVSQEHLFRNTHSQYIIEFEYDVKNRYTSMSEQFSLSNSESLYVHTEAFHNKKQGEQPRIRGTVTQHIGLGQSIQGNDLGELETVRVAKPIELFYLASIARGIIRNRNKTLAE